MITISKENYLKAIAEIEAEDGKAIAATLAHWLKVSAPAVTMALRRLKKDGLITVSARGRVLLTPEGAAIARRTLTRHHLIEHMLSEVFGMEWYELHDEAERLEHAVSADFEAKLQDKFGSEAACPHGNNAMPENSRTRRKRGWRLLSEAEPGKHYVITSVYERDRELLRFLDRYGIKPGTPITAGQWNYDQTLVLETPTGRLAVGYPVSEKVWIIAAAKMPRKPK